MTPDLSCALTISQAAARRGAPKSMLGNAMTEDEARAMADQAIAWRADSAPKPPATAAVPAYGVSQISRETLSHLSPAQVNQVYREGRLEQIGAPAPHTGDRRR